MDDDDFMGDDLLDEDDLKVPDAASLRSASLYTLHTSLFVR